MQLLNLNQKARGEMQSHSLRLPIQLVWDFGNPFPIEFNAMNGESIDQNLTCNSFHVSQNINILILSLVIMKMRKWVPKIPI